MQRKLYAVMNEKHDNRYNNHSYNSPITPSPSGFSGDTLNSRNAEVPKLCCLSSRGRCYFMVLLNLVMNAAILGILIVLLIPFFEPIYLWIFGILFLFFGSLTLLVTVRFYKMGMKEEATSCFFFLC